MIEATALTWGALQSRWTSHSVSLVEVLPPEDCLARLYVRAWVKRDGTAFPQQSNPVNSTARHLAAGGVTQSPALFAAFAIATFIRSEGRNPYNRDVLTLIDRNLTPGERALLTCWTSTAVKVLPRAEAGELAPGDWRDWREPHDWTFWVDRAADRWSGLAAEFSVVDETQHLPRSPGPTS